MPWGHVATLGTAVSVAVVGVVGSFTPLSPSRSSFTAPPNSFQWKDEARLPAGFSAPAIPLENVEPVLVLLPVETAALEPPAVELISVVTEKPVQVVEDKKPSTEPVPQSIAKTPKRYFKKSNMREAKTTARAVTNARAVAQRKAPPKTTQPTQAQPAQPQTLWSRLGLSELAARYQASTQAAQASRVKPAPAAPYRKPRA